MKKFLVLMIMLSFILSGCSLNMYKTSKPEKIKVESLKSQVDQLQTERDLSQQKLKQKENELDAIQRELQELLKNDKRVKLEMQDRGLVITLANNILFDSGKAKIKKGAYQVLNDIANVIETTALKQDIGVEGHTDNVPIKHSGWKSNRELSTARANEVYHYLVEQGVDPSRITTMGYGEYRPVSTNDTPEGRAENRRVEIVILPEFSRKQGKISNDNFAVIEEEVIVEEYIK
ncbi:MAG: OmpA family protein [Candidatus Omnitrophica bacterium]|nr:OmpA family protein [Candidatus Omnitrophota bacterium]